MHFGLGPIFNPVSPQAGAISGLFAVVLGICSLILAVVVLTVGYCVWRCRGSSDAPDPTPVYGHRNLEIAWTAVPLLIVIFIFVLTARVMSSSDPDKSRPADLLVTGHQFWWDVNYTASGFHTANEIHLAVGQPLLVQIESADVLHDFWVPQLARKIHAVPGHPNAIWLEADRIGTYDGVCAEFCGAQHAWMHFTVVVQNAADYAAWVQEQQKPLSTNAITGVEGEKIFRQFSCINCHSLHGIATNSLAGPDLTHVGTRLFLGGGVLANSPENLARWLLNPQAIKPSCFMPNFKFTAAQSQQLAAFLETRP